jgi:amino acid permease
VSLYQPIDSVPLWVLFAGTVLIVLLAVEVGYRLGARHRQRQEHEHEAAVGAMTAATLALLAFMLAFTFGMAGSRLDARRELVLEEANAIGTTYLRAQMLSEPYRTEICILLRKYAAIRAEGAQKGRVEEAIAKSEQLQDQIWSQAVVVGEKNPNSIVVGLFIQSLNEMIDVHSKRITALRNRIPTTIWIALYFVSLLGMAATGYHSGLTGPRSRPMYALLVLTFAAVLWLIADLDRPGEGFLRVSQYPMIELKNKLTASAPSV